MLALSAKCKSYIRSLQDKDEIAVIREAQSFREVITLVLAGTDAESRAKFPRKRQPRGARDEKKHVSSPVHLCVCVCVIIFAGAGAQWSLVHR